jgi:hypothetical protein
MNGKKKYRSRLFLPIGPCPVYSRTGVTVILASLQVDTHFDVKFGLQFIMLLTYVEANCLCLWLPVRFKGYFLDYDPNSKTYSPENNK